MSDFFGLTKLYSLTGISIHVVGAEYFSRTRWKRMSASRGKSAARALTYRVAIARG